MSSLFLGIAEDDGVSMAILGDASGNVIGHQLGKSFDYRLLGVNTAQSNLYSLVNSLPGMRHVPRLDTVSVALKTHATYWDQQLSSLVRSVVSTSNVKVHSFVEAAMRSIPGKEPEILVLTDNRGSVLARSQESNITKFRRGGGAMDVIASAFDLVRNNPTMFGVDEVRRSLQKWLDDPCLSRAGSIALEIDMLAEMGNPAALEIMLAAAATLIDAVSAMIKYTGKSNPLIGLCGCIVLGSQIVKERFCQMIEILFPESQIEAAELAPAKGAYLSGLTSSVR